MKTTEEYELIIRFNSDRNFFEVRNEIIDKILDDELFSDLQIWEFRRGENSVLASLEEDNKEVEE